MAEQVIEDLLNENARMRFCYDSKIQALEERLRKVEHDNSVLIGEIFEENTRMRFCYDGKIQALEEKLKSLEQNSTRMAEEMLEENARARFRYDRKIEELQAHIGQLELSNVELGFKLKHSEDTTSKALEHSSDLEKTIEAFMAAQHDIGQRNVISQQTFVDQARELELLRAQSVLLEQDLSEAQAQLRNTGDASVRWKQVITDYLDQVDPVIKLMAKMSTHKAMTMNILTIAEARTILSDHQDFM